MSEGDTQDRLATDEEPQRQPSSADSSVMGAIGDKACCVCGVDLHGRMRYKDSAGRYWCPTCNEKDQMSRQPAVCPDCNGNFTRAQLVEFKGTPVCGACWERRRQAARREEARLRAVEEEIREEQETRKRWMYIIGGFLALLTLWGAGMLVFWLLAR